MAHLQSTRYPRIKNYACLITGLSRVIQLVSKLIRLSTADLGSSPALGTITNADNTTVK